MCCLLYLYITHFIYIYMGFCVFVLCVVEDDISKKFMILLNENSYNPV